MPPGASRRKRSPLRVRLAPSSLLSLLAPHILPIPSSSPCSFRTPPVPRYFDDEIACQKYFKNTNMGYFLSAGGDEATTEVKKKTGTKSKQKQGVDDLLLGHIDLAALTYFQESYRLDLNHRAMELKTQRRTWVLQVDGVADFYNWCVRILTCVPPPRLHYQHPHLHLHPHPHSHTPRTLVVPT